MYDLFLKNGRIVDGTRKKAWIGNVGIRGEKIVYVGSNGEEDSITVIDCTGKYIAPGFIDHHSHGDIVLGEEFPAIAKLSQGITTEIVGQCGVSLIPVRKKYLPELLKSVESFMTEPPEEMERFEQFEHYMDYVRKLDLYLNCRCLIGHSSLRIAAMGMDNRKPTDKEFDEMKEMLRDAMAHGALGMSSGLIYTPGVYAKTEELIELCKIVREYGGIYATHMRNESFDVVKSVKEAIDVAKAAEVPLVISHHKVAGSAYWGLSKETLALVDAEVKNGMEITIDQYPYEAGMTHLNICIPPQYMSEGIPGLIEKLKDPDCREAIKQDMIEPSIPYDNFYLNCGGFDGIQITWCPKTANAMGRSVGEYANSLGKDAFETYFDLLIENEGIGIGAFFCMGQEDIERIIGYPYTVVGTDGIVKSAKDPVHPRAFGTFPCAIRKFVKEKNLMSLEDMIYKMTFLPAQRMQMPQKGVLKEGFDADIVVFDYEQLRDEATYKEPSKRSVGIDYVLVNGKIAMDHNVLIAKGLGRVL